MNIWPECTLSNRLHPMVWNLNCLDWVLSAVYRHCHVSIQQYSQPKAHVG
jgi:hypothetical protein